MKFITFLFTLIITTNSFGQNWDFKVQSTKGNEYYLDMKSIKPKGSLTSYSQLKKLS